MADLLLHSGVVITMDAARRILEPGWVAVTGDQISAVGGGQDSPPDAAERVDLAGRVVLPGLVSAHQHSMDTLLRAAAYRPVDFPDWLFGVYYRGVAAMTPRDAGLAATLAVLHSQRAGITTFCDNWGVAGGAAPEHVLACAEATLAAYRRAGERVVVARMLGDVLPAPLAAAAQAAGVDPDLLVAPADRVLDEVGALMAANPPSGLVAVCPAPELPEMASPRLRRAVVELARSAGTPLCTHLAASEPSAAAAPLAMLAGEGFLGPGLLGAHAGAVTVSGDAVCGDRSGGASDVALLAAHGVRIAHCPTASAALASPVTPVNALRAAGVTVGLGVDNPSLNSAPDLFDEARWADRLARMRASAPHTAAGSGGTAPLDGIAEADLLAMVTIDGARCLGLADRIGSIEPGKQADLTVLDASGPHWWPRGDWPTAVIRYARAADVRDVYVAGRRVLAGGAPTWLTPGQLAELAAAAQEATTDLLRRAGLAAPA